MYVFLSSDCSKEYFPSNTPSNFTCILPKRMELSGNWEVALMQIEYPSSAQSARVNVYTDIINNVMYGDDMIPILRRINVLAKGKFININVPFYMPLNKDYIDQISIHIMGDTKVTHSFSSYPLKCTLHFRKCLQ